MEKYPSFPSLLDFIWQSEMPTLAASRLPAGRKPSWQEAFREEPGAPSTPDICVSHPGALRQEHMESWTLEGFGASSLLEETEVARAFPEGRNQAPNDLLISPPPTCPWEQRISQRGERENHSEFTSHMVSPSLEVFKAQLYKVMTWFCVVISPTLSRNLTQSSPEVPSTNTPVTAQE